MQRVEFNGWVLEVDKTATEDAYAEIEFGGAVGCGCNDCVRFDIIRMELLPPSVLNLFSELRIEPSKEAETASFGPDEEGRDIWSWWYHFVGRIVEVPESAKSEGDASSIALSTDFAIGFVESAFCASESLFSRGSLVQVECFYYKGKAVV